MFTRSDVKCGDILWTQFDPGVGHEFQDKRPALVVQNDGQLAKSNLITLVAMTGNIRNKMEDDIIIEPDEKNGLRSASVIKVYDITSFDYQRIFGKIGKASEQIMVEVRRYLEKHFGL
ncbi:MAG: type II toxin-antitoxin system PemK/MazF family toxin [Candidatus Magasanikbacteria bacterium]|nr:type II toxin-antitoxin system PemK/MazF family toxin [Candidatus Magasanikbacteria bacterium]